MVYFKMNKVSAREVWDKQITDIIIILFSRYLKTLNSSVFKTKFNMMYMFYCISRFLKNEETKTDMISVICLAQTFRVETLF